MKKKLIILLTAMIIILIAVVIILNTINPNRANVSREKDQLKVLTTFYPVYMIGLNLVGNMEELEVTSLTDVNTGCLHDYQLTTQDMKSIAEADVIVMNGGGMEHFLEDILEDYPEITVIDASQGITMLPNEGWELHDEEEYEEEFNAHVWLDPKLYIQQIKNVQEGLSNFISGQPGDHSALLQTLKDNSNNYIHKVQEIDDKINSFMNNTLAADDGQNAGQAVIFHNAFEYLANRIGLEVAFSVPLDADTALSASQIKEIIDEVNAGNIKYLFTEAQYEDTIAQRIEDETQASVYIIDSAVTGDGSRDSYLNAMNHNLQILEEAFQ